MARLLNIPHSLCLLLVVVALANASVTWRRVTKQARSSTQDLTSALAPSTTKSTITWRRSTKSRRSTTRREEPPPPVEEDDIDTADSREQASLFEDDSDQESPVKPLVPGSRPGFWLDSSRRKKPSTLLKPGVRRNSLFPTKPSRRTTVSTTTEKLTPVPIVSFISKSSVTTPQPVSSPSKLKLYGRNQSTKSPVAFRRRIKVTKSPRISSTTAAPVSEESDIVEELSLEPEEKKIKNNEREFETDFKSTSENTEENSAENVQSKPPKSIQKPSLGIRRRPKNGTRLSWRKEGLRVTPRTTSAPRSTSSSTASTPDVTSTKIYGRSRKPSAFPRLRSRVRANRTTSSPKIWTREEQSSTSPDTPTTVKVQDKKRLERIRFHTRNRNTHKFSRVKAKPIPEESEEQSEDFTTTHPPTEYEVTLTPTTAVYEVSTSRTTVEPYYLTRDYGQLITAIAEEHWTKEFSSTRTTNPLKTSTDSFTRTTIPEPTSTEVSTQSPFPTIPEEEIYTNGTTESSEEAFQYPEEPQYAVSNYSELSQYTVSNQNEDTQYDVSNQNEDNQYPVIDQNEDHQYHVSDQNEDNQYPVLDQNEDHQYHVSDQNEDPQNHVSEQNENPQNHVSEQNEDPQFPVSDQNEAPQYTESNKTTYEDDSENIVEEAFVSVTSKPLEIGGNLKNKATITEPSLEIYQNTTTSRPSITFPTISHTINPGTNAYVVWSLGQGGSSWSYERQGEQVKWSAQNSAAAGDRWSVQGEEDKIKIDHTPWKPTRSTSKFLSDRLTSKKNDSKVPLTDKLNKEKPEEPVTYTPSVPYLKQIPLKIQTTPETYNFPPLSDDEFSKISSDFTNFTSSFYQDAGTNFLPGTQDVDQNFGTWLNGSSVFYPNAATPYAQPNGKETFINHNKLNVPYIAEIRETYNDVPNFDQAQLENASNSQGQVTDTPNISEEDPVPPTPYKLPEINYGIGFDYNLPQTTYSPFLSGGVPSYDAGSLGSQDGGQLETVSTNYDGSNSFSGLPPELARAVVDAKRWTVVGNGGPEGWALLGEDGILEWKIHNIDGKWTVTSADELVKMPLQIPASSEAAQDSEQDKTESQKSEEVQKTRPKIWTLEDDYEKWRVLSAERGVQVGSPGNRPNTEYDYDQTEENQEDDYYDEDEEEDDYGETTNAYAPYQFNENFEDRPMWEKSQMIPNYLDKRPNPYSPYGREIEAANTKDDAIEAWKSLLVDQGTWKLSAEEKNLANPSLSHQYHYSNPSLVGSDWKVSSPPAVNPDRSDENVQTPQITALGNYAGAQGKPAAEYKPYQTQQNQKANTPTAEYQKERKHDKENGRPLQEKDRAKIEALIKKLENIQKEAKGRAVIDLSQLLKLVRANKNSTSALSNIKSNPDAKTSSLEISETEIKNGQEQVKKEKHSKQSQQDSDESKLHSLVQNLQQQTSISQNSLDELQKYIETLKEKRLDNSGKGINRNLDRFVSHLNHEQISTGIQGKTGLANKFYDKTSEAKDHKFLSSLPSYSPKIQGNPERASNQRRPDAEDGSKLKPIESNKYIYNNNRRADENLNENISYNENYGTSNGLAANSRYKLSHQNIEYINGQKVSDVRHEEKRIYSDKREYDEHFRSTSKHSPGAYSSKKHFSDLLAPKDKRLQPEERYRSKVPSYLLDQPGYPFSEKPVPSQKKSDARLEEDKGPNGEIAFEDDYRLAHGRNQRYSKSKPRRKQNRPRTGSRGQTLRQGESLLQHDDGRNFPLTHTNVQISKEIGYSRPKYSSAELREKHQSSRRKSRPGRKSQQQKLKSSVRPHTKVDSSEELIVNVRDHPQIYDSYEEKRHLEEHFYEPSPNTHLRRQRRPSKKRPHKHSRSPPVVLSSETEIEDEEDGSKKSRKIIVIDYAGRHKKKSPIDRKDLELIIRNVKNRRSELMEESSSERRHKELVQDP